MPRSRSRETRTETVVGANNGSRTRSSVVATTTRARRPTPVPRRAGGQPRSSSIGRGQSRSLSDDYIYNEHDDDDMVSSDEQRRYDRDHPLDRHQRSHQHRHPVHHDTHVKHRHVSISTRSQNGAGRSTTQRQVTVTSDGCHSPPLTWYERMMPECLLTLTAPITGYEHQLETRPDMDPIECEILERERIRRNRRIRRRVLTIVVAASLASAYFIWRGRIPGRRPGVRGAITSVADGLSKSIHDTMGK
jgi:hypothetical protein